MEDLIKALQIFLKYGNPDYPTICNHEELFVDIEPEKVSEEDLKTLEELGFFPTEDGYGFYSFRFGSC
jgi:hypothetical protein